MFIFSKITACRFSLLCVLAIFCFYQTPSAQSGRRGVKKSSSSEQQSTAESKSAKTEDDAPTNEISVQISSLLIVGEVQNNFAYSNSNTIDAAFKELIKALQSAAKNVTEISKGGGKVNYKEAKEQAERETVTFVLWLGFSEKNDSYGNMHIDKIQYAVLMPKTAKVVTRGEIEPEENGVFSPVGGLSLPKTRRSAATELIQMKKAARQIAVILVRGGWLK